MEEDIVFDLWLQSVETEEKCCMATVLQENTTKAYRSLRLCMTEKGNIESTIHDEQLMKALQEIITEKMQSSLATSETIEIKLSNEQSVQVFVDIFIPKPKVMIFGAGHDAIPVAKYSVSLGFHTVVIDAREMYNNEMNFPDCERLILRLESFEENVKITNYTYIIVMNHHIEKDRDTLQLVLNSPAPYIGVLGPRSRREKMLAYLEEDGIVFTEEALQKMYNPIGLDIGAETPEEIAISMMAEIIAIQKGHQGGFLHDKNQIHRYTSKHEEVVDEALCKKG